MRPKIPALISYGLLALPLAFAGLPLFVHAPDYYATQLGVSLAALGVVLLALRLVDAIQDPLIGALSDRFHAARHGVILIGAVLLGGGFYLLFHPVGAPLWSFALSVLICTTGFSMVGINLQALGGLWRVDPAAQVSVSATREGLGLIGLLIASVTPALLMQVMPREAALHILTLICLAMLTAGCACFYLWYRRADIAAPSTLEPLRFRELFRSSWLRRFCGIYGLSTLASSIPAVLVLFYVRDHLGAEPYAGLFLIGYFLSGALTMPLWQKLAKSQGQLKAWGISMALATATFVWAFLLPPGAIWPFFVVCLLSGTAFGADLALPPALIAARLTSEGHERAAGRYYALLAFLSKASLALATGVSLPLLDWAGYVPGETAQGMVLPVAYALVPCGLKLLSAVWLWRSRAVLGQGRIDA